MESYLVDTHIFIWWLSEDKKLNKSTQKILKDPNSHIYVSIATLWEISIKNTAGKLPLKTTITEMVSFSGFELLSINLSHVLNLGKLPIYHNDPFDRMLIAQAKAEGLTLLTDDRKIKKYDIKVI
ncbi:MAG: type II toxin-antitoxin system VapC family toxin [Patescibacteria group bacterium]